MTWEKKYDKINRTWEGDVGIFGNHYNLQEAKDIMDKEKWDDISEINKLKRVEHVWLHFGFVCDNDGEIVNGWKVLDNEPENKRGCIKATMVYLK